MSKVSEHDSATDAPDEESDGSPAGVWVTVAFFVAFVVLMSGCIGLQSLF